MYRPLTVTGTVTSHTSALLRMVFAPAMLPSGGHDDGVDLVLEADAMLALTVLLGIVTSLFQ